MPSRQRTLRRWLIRSDGRSGLGLLGATPKQSRLTAGRWRTSCVDTISQSFTQVTQYFFQAGRSGSAVRKSRASPRCDAALPEAEAGAGEIDAGLRRLGDALAELEATENRWYEAEMHRIRAEILLKRDPAN